MRQVPAGSRRSRAAGSSPGPALAPLPVPVPGPGRFRWLPPRSLRPARPLLPLLAVLAASTVLFLAWPGGERGTGRTGGTGGTGGADGPEPLPEPALRSLLARLDPARLWGSLLRPLLHERVPGGPGSRAAREHILSHLRSLGAAWHLELDTFTARTPRGPVTFSSVVATAAPGDARRLALACHYDTKVLGDTAGDSGDFVGATDAAVPCALLLEVAAALDAHLRDRERQAPPLTLQLLFLDGEEAFEAWSDSDSLYGARHLAAKMAARGHPAGSEVTAMSLFVLLDLLGAPGPAIHSHFPQTQRWFLRLHAIEQRLRALRLLRAAPPAPPFFRLSPAPGPVEDDHVPFLRRGVPVLHVIPTPFPRVWHSLGDTEQSLDRDTVTDLARILLVFVAEFLQI
ncbi:glutaminyl-peptide cyclotransferase-like protein [Catharus ustulatus]|uniref:glutaminyl-peptide cyclotransferase-like protein n=1 Tax=Catharus ustulatus TaxID=91951 RepID=UPI001407C3EF|nr:glutaminyl-peptide cyclotransferase-like protein [Catharus ustulatus]